MGSLTLIREQVIFHTVCLFQHHKRYVPPNTTICWDARLERIHLSPLGGNPLHWLVGIDIQAINKQWGMFGAVGVSAVQEHVIGKLPDGVEVFTTLVRIWDCFTEADRELAN